MANSNKGREGSNRVSSSSAEQDLTAGFSKPLQETPGSLRWKPSLVGVNKVKIEELMKQELPNLDERRFRRQEPEQLEGDELGRRKWPEERIPIDLEPITGFNLRAQVVGHGGAYVKYIQQETHCRLQIKGRGSGFTEPQTGRESDESMYLHVAGPDPETVKRARELCEDLLSNVKDEYEKFKEREPSRDHYGGDFSNGRSGYGDRGDRDRSASYGYGGSYGGHGGQQSSGKTASVHASSDHADKNQAADTKERLGDFDSIYGGDLSAFLDWDYWWRTDPDSPRKYDDTGYGTGAAESFPTLPNIDEGSSQVTEYFSRPSLSSLANNSKETSVLGSLPTVWDIQNDTAFGFDTNVARSKQQSHVELDRTTVKQRNFMRRWYEGLRRERGSMTPLSKEYVSALATLIDLQPQIVHSWITRNLITGANKDEQAASRSLANTTISDPQTPISSIDGSVNGTANITPGKKRKYVFGGPGGGGRYIEIDMNLSSEILQLIENHIKAYNSKRGKVGGRRRAYTGKYECTFDCGYRTKRAFEWKRHEKSHQPQDFWLCSICNQEGRTFLVHRTDKLLKHIQGQHASSNPRDVIKSSEIAFKASLKPQCGFCGCTFEFWEDRNKHILYHFDAEGREARNMSQWREPWYDGDLDEYTSDKDPGYAGQSAGLEDITNHLVEPNPHEDSLATLPDLRKLEAPQSKGSRQTLPPLQGLNSPTWNGPNQGSKLPSFRRLNGPAEVGSNFLDEAIANPLLPVEPELANDSQAARADDIQSVLSLRTFNDSAFYSGQRSSLGSDALGVPKTAKEQVLNILSSDLALKTWFATIAQKVDRDRFVRNARRLIGHYYLDLLKEVQDVRERNAVQILRDNMPWFAVNLQETFDPQTPSRKVHIQEAPERQTFDRLYLLEKHLATTIHSEVMETKDDITNDTISAVDSFEDDLEPIDYTRFPNIAQIRTFLTGGVAFQRLRENLHCFVSGQAMEIDELIDQPSQEPAGREILELPSDRPTKRGLEKLLDGNDCSNPRKRQLHRTSLGPKIGELTEAISYNNFDQDETHSSSSPLSPSTKPVI